MTVEPTTTNRTATYILLGVLLIGMAITILVLVQTATQPANDSPAAELNTEYTGTVYEPPVQLSAFTMPSTNGEPLSLSDLNGRWTLLFFGYTHCPDFCPLTLSEFKRIKALLAEDAGKVQFVFVSVDAERDTPEVLAAYLNRFDPTFIGLSPDEETLKRIQPEYGMFYERRIDTGSQASYLVDHSTRSYLIDPQGRLSVTYAYGTEPAVIAESIRGALQRADT